MARLLGQYECQIDAKGRVSFPSAFRRALAAAHAGDSGSAGAGDSGSAGGCSALVLLQWRPTHLDLYPEETWREIEQRLKEHRRVREDSGAYMRRITSQATEVDPDDHGRIRIPPWLRERAGLEGAALFIGAVDRIEIWSPERFATEMDAQDADDDFAPRIFG